MGDGTNCQDTKFSVTTTSLAAGDVFSFAMSAQGTFYVDCGTDGTLSSAANDVSGKTITRTNTTEALYTCTYTTGNVKTIRFSGRATMYNSGRAFTSAPVILFGKPYGRTVNTTYTLVAAIDGSLGAIFPTLGQSDALQPTFGCTFQHCDLIRTIPENLFSGITGNTTMMFFQTFLGCSNLAAIPENLFSGITGSASNLFRNAFWGTGITEIPANLFSGVYGGDGATEMFFMVFRNCVNLTAIPEGLFSGVTATANQMFDGAFYGDTNLSGYIPPSTFAGLIANGSPTVTTMWSGIFDGTNVATTCPSGTTQYTTGYESAWSGRVSCQVTTPQVCSGGEYLPAAYNECIVCSANSYCTGGTYSFNASAAQGITACPVGYGSPAGASACTPNTVTIEWDGANGTYQTGSCTYGGGFNTPTTPPTRRGYRFDGWTFVGQ